MQEKQVGYQPQKSPWVLDGARAGTGSFGRSRCVLTPSMTAALLLLLLFVGHVFVNGLWLHEDLGLTWFDEGRHLTFLAMGRTLWRELGWTGLVRFALEPPGPVPPFWPKVGYLPAILASEALGQGLFGVRLGTSLWLGVLFVSLFLMGRRLGSPASGLVAATLAGAYPAVFGASRHVTQDMAAIALVALVLCLLLATERFSRPLSCLGLGLGLGLATLVRPHVVFFVAVPLFVQAGRSLLWPAGQPRGRIAIHLLLAALPALLLVGLVLGPHRSELVELMVMHQHGNPMPLPTLTRETAFYLRSLPDAVSWVPLVASIVGAGLVLVPPCGSGKSDNSLKYGYFIILFITAGFGLGLLELLDHRLPRYLFPALPILALLAALGVTRLRSPVFRRIALVGLLGPALLVWLLCSFWAGRPWPGSCDPCRDLAMKNGRESAGAPTTLKAPLAAMQAARYLRERHGEGDGVLLRLHPTSTASFATEQVLRPILASELPGARFSRVGGPATPAPECPFDSFLRLPMRRFVVYTLFWKSDPEAAPPATEPWIALTRPDQVFLVQEGPAEGSILLFRH